MNKKKNIPVFLQRQIEAQLLKPIIEGLSEEFGKESILKNIKATVEKIAFESGRKLAEDRNDNSLTTLAEHWQNLAEGEALTMKNLNLSDSKLTFKITRCKYAEYYKQLGVEKLGDTLSCCRDRAFLKGFSDYIKMVRSASILEGNVSCDFEYSYTRKDLVDSKSNS